MRGTVLKAVILAGGLGTRISEETTLRPKPMIEIGGKPILWHIMKSYSTHGIHEFVICCGYKGYMIKEFFANYFLHTSDITFDLKNNNIEVHSRHTEPWKVTLVDTGEDTMTGGRLKRVRKFIEDDEAFCFTYGDGVSNINITETIDFHKKHGKLATMTAVQPAGRFGAIELQGQSVSRFKEKPQGDNSWINGGYFVLSPKVINYIAGDETFWEKEPLEYLATNNQIDAYKHHGFWQPMDTLRDKMHLEELCAKGAAPWKTWL
jgi:glucose-1-phosphate cytidylyltransferase